jgi:uncharacterized caspase-like protein
MSHTFTHGYALLVGVDENRVSGYALPDVAKDIQAVTEVLIHPRRCAYPKDNVKTLTGQEATRQGILDGLEWLQERIQADSSDNTTAIVYYTGHGWHNAAAGSSEFYLIPYDIREDKIRSRALRAMDFAEAVGRDTCVKAINDFRQEHGLTPLVVCSRTADYEALTNPAQDSRGGSFAAPHASAS